MSDLLCESSIRISYDNSRDYTPCRPKIVSLIKKVVIEVRKISVHMIYRYEVASRKSLFTS